MIARLTAMVVSTVCPHCEAGIDYSVPLEQTYKSYPPNDEDEYGGDVENGIHAPLDVTDREDFQYNLVTLRMQCGACGQWFTLIVTDERYHEKDFENSYLDED
jgi:hypothetical protein